jgi:hypothetical protein
MLKSLWWSSKFCGLLIHQRRVDRAVGSGGFLSYACYCFISSSWLVLSMLEMQVSDEYTLCKEISFYFVIKCEIVGP